MVAKGAQGVSGACNAHYLVSDQTREDYQVCLTGFPSVSYQVFRLDKAQVD